MRRAAGRTIVIINNNPSDEKDSWSQHRQQHRFDHLDYHTWYASVCSLVHSESPSPQTGSLSLYNSYVVAPLSSILVMQASFIANASW